MVSVERPLRHSNNKARLLTLLMAGAQWADSARLRRWFPESARGRLHDAKKWLFRQPVRFAFDRDADAVRLVVIGEPFADWPLPSPRRRRGSASQGRPCRRSPRSC